jgi:hypothetical protein
MARTLTRDSGTHTTSALAHGRSRLMLVALRLAGAGLTVAMAWIHLYLWDDGGYRSIAKIGTLFLLNAIGGGLLAIALLVTPNRFLAVISGLGALFTAGTLGGLVLSMTHGLYNVHETWATPWVTETVWVESAGTVVLALLAVAAWRAHGLGLPRRRP